MADQDPSRIIELAERTYHAERATGREGIGNARCQFWVALTAYRRTTGAIRAAAAVLEEMYGREPYQTRSGGSIPITGVFQEQLGVDTISFGFGIEDENYHAPDEFFRLASFRKGQAAYCKLLHKFGESSLTKAEKLETKEVLQLSSGGELKPQDCIENAYQSTDVHLCG